MSETTTEKEDPTKNRDIVLGYLPQVSGVYLNVSQNLIVITEDKLRIHLSKSTKKMEKRGGWMAPLGIFVSLLLSILTADFKNFGLESSTWEAMFIIGAVASFLWLAYALLQRLHVETVDEVIERIKKEPK